MTGRDVRLFGAMMACALAASATTAAALPKPRYAVDGAETSHGKAKHDTHKPDLPGGPKGGKGTYVVAHGDTLSSIAHKVGVPQKDLAAANDLHGHALKPGMKLHVPRAIARDTDREEADATPHGRKGAKAHSETYTVAHGDTLSSIARKLGVTTRELSDANDLHGRALKPGMKLHAPGATDAREAASDQRPARGKHADAAPATYTVAHGDTLSSVARKLHVSQQALADANGLHGKALRSGMKLHVPGAEAPAEVASDDRPTHGKHADSGDTAPVARGSYTVAHGDTLAGVARKLHVSQKALADANDLHGRPLRSGMKLKLPGGDAATAEVARGAAQPTAGGGTYTVARGDTLTGVARRFHVTAREIIKANDLAPGEPVDRGMKLKLPADARDHGRDAHASGALILPKVRVAATKSAPIKTPAYAPTPSPEAPVVVAAASPPPEPVRISPPPHDYVTPRTDNGAAALPKPRPAAAVTSGDTEGPPPAPGSPTFRAANDHAVVTSIHPPVSHGYPSPSELAALGKGRFIWPVRGDVVTRFGDQGHGLANDGLNIGADLGASVRSAADGQVVYAGESQPLGNMILVKHADGWLTAYGHLSRIDVKISQRVQQGDQIGQVGASGGIDRPQLHFEVRYAPPSSREKARAVDPSTLLP